jgi:hypothetical protein
VPSRQAATTVARGRPALGEGWFFTAAARQRGRNVSGSGNTAASRFADG